jgi:hypothetical protein
MTYFKSRQLFKTVCFLEMLEVSFLSRNQTVAMILRLCHISIHLADVRLQLLIPVRPYSLAYFPKL